MTEATGSDIVIFKILLFGVPVLAIALTVIFIKAIGKDNDRKNMK